MIEFFVKRPVTTIMFVLVFVVLGVFALAKIPIESSPKIDFPIVTIAVTYPGATPVEVETLVVKKIEDVVSQLSEIKNISSQSYDNYGMIFIEFQLGTSVNVKSIEVKDKVEAIQNDLPDGCEKPVIEKFDPLMTPVMDLVLYSDNMDGLKLYEYADKTLKNKVSSVSGVAKVDVYGGKERQIEVKLDPVLMKQHYITISEVINAIKAQNQNIPGGLLEKDRSSLNVRFIGEFQDVSKIADMVITSKDGTSFPLKDIGKVEDSYKKVETMARFNGKNVVGLSVNMVSDGNAVNISRAMNERLDEFRAGLPKGMDLDIASDTTPVIINRTNNTYWSIFIGILLTVLILYFFTGEAKLTFIAGIVIPTSLVSTLAAISGSGFSINMITLMAIATSLGTLIANAIVIVESVLVHLEHHEDPRQAAIAGTKEVAVAVFASTGTNLVVFAPLAMMGGIIGLFMHQFGLTIIYATTFSLLASYSLTPMLCGLLLKKEDIKPEQKKNNNPLRLVVNWTTKMVDFLRQETKYLFDLQFKFPKATILFVVILLASLLFILPYIDSDFMASSDADKVMISIAMPQGSTIERTLETVLTIEKRLNSIPEKESILTNIGKNGVENASITLDLKPAAERKRSDLDIINELIPFMAQIPDAEIDVSRGQHMAGSAGDVSIDLYGVDYDKMIGLSQLMKTEMEKTGYFRSVSCSYKTPKAELQFIPDQKKLVQYGLTADKIGPAIRSSIYGNDENKYKEVGEEYDIHVGLDKGYTVDFNDLREISLVSTRGLIPITALGTLKNDKSLPSIKHADKRRVIRLEGYLSKSSLGYVRQVLDARFKKLPFTEGYGYDYVGMAEMQKESVQEISTAFILAVILTFMLLCAVLDSMIYPLVIMTTVATSYIGVMYALFFMEMSINMASMLTMVMVVGIVVNNAILMLDHALQKMKEGIEVKEALWLGASDKFRAILMTSLAIILGVLPQLWSSESMERSMGAVMVGGIFASILFTFIFVPVCFWYIERIRQWLSGKFSKAKGPAKQ
ncbi:MAG: efflux RND transporter permease subunit [bacterium]|nr:efflux RND transporter permease subunit [bacterium]